VAAPLRQAISRISRLETHLVEVTGAFQAGFQAVDKLLEANEISQLTPLDDTILG
jgi:hypothetical protein